MKKAKILENLVPKNPPPKKRKFVAISVKDYDVITKMAERLGVARGKVVTALVQFYQISDDS